MTPLKIQFDFHKVISPLTTPLTIRNPDSVAGEKPAFRPSKELVPWSVIADCQLAWRKHGASFRPIAWQQPRNVYSYYTKNLSL